MTRGRSANMVYLVSGLVIGLLFAIDMLLPGGPAPAIGYCAAVALIGQTGRRRSTLVLSAVCVLLTLLGYGLEEPSGLPLWLALLNTFMVVAVIALTAAIVLMRQKSVEELEKRTEELARSNQELEHFATAVSHDLRSPLLSINGCAKLLEGQVGDGPGAESRELLGFIQESVGRMDEMIGRMLRYARLGAQPLELKPCDVNRVVEQVVGDLRATMESDEAQITHDPLPTVRADERLLARVFQNLFENAIKYRGDKPPRIHVSARRGQTEWVFSVRDNGMGIPSQHLKTIFGLFDRAGQDGSKRPGSGVGLATCKKIIERHGGGICAESQVGVGSTFYVTLPDRSG